MLPSRLQNPSTDVSAAGFTFHPILGVVIRLTVWHSILADVLSCEDHVAGPTSEAADVPLLLQRQERLTLLDLVSAPSTVAGPVDLDRFIWLDERVRALLAHAVLSAERHSVSDGEGFTAETADKALGVVRASQSRDHLSGDEAVTAVAARTVQTLIVCRADVLALLLEETGSSQITVTHGAGETLDVKVGVLYSHHLSFAYFPTSLAPDLSRASFTARRALLMSTGTHDALSLLI